MNGSSLLASGEEVKTIIGLAQALANGLCIDRFIARDFTTRHVLLATDRGPQGAATGSEESLPRPDLQRLRALLTVSRGFQPWLQALWIMFLVGVNESTRAVDWRQMVGMEVAERKGGKRRLSLPEVRQSQAVEQPRAHGMCCEQSLRRNHCYGCVLAASSCAILEESASTWDCSANICWWSCA